MAAMGIEKTKSAEVLPKLRDELASQTKDKMRKKLEIAHGQTLALFCLKFCVCIRLGYVLM